MQRTVTLCGKNSVLLVLMKTVHIITIVLHTVEKSRSEKVEEKYANKMSSEKQMEQLKQNFKARKSLCRLTLISSWMCRRVVW
jgi:hypothetical protein